MSTFKQYLAKRLVTDDPIGDFLKDSKNGKDLPSITKLEDLECFLRSKNACSGALQAGREVWLEYQATLKV
ncbi:MAG: hypothetical protein ABF785_11915 [Acetobacter papayae]|uniref:hypothetical protein n=1 Tax=Acetobacter papayae TaxID=1076592 RepID=UPI0039E7E126